MTSYLTSFSGGNHFNTLSEKNIFYIAKHNNSTVAKPAHTHSASWSRNYGVMSCCHPPEARGHNQRKSGSSYFGLFL